MRKSAIAIAVALAMTATAAVAKKPRDAEFLAAQAEIRAAKIEAAAATPDETGDPASHGRSVKFLGLMQSGVVNLLHDCSAAPGDPPPNPDDRCITIAAAPTTTTFNELDVGRMVIPGRSAKSMFCHWQTPIVTYRLANNTGAFHPAAQMVVTPTYTIQNAVLNDPALIDPGTGLPFGGQFTVGLTGVRETISLQPGESQVTRETGTRTCIAGIVSRANLISMGLSETQADNFFKNDTVITMNITGNARLVDFATILYGLRIVGD